MNLKLYTRRGGLKLALVMAFTLLSVMTALAQVKVTGKVTDKNGPLPGVTVHIKGKSGVATSTNQDGEYSLTVSDNEILVFRMLGYDSKEAPVKGKAKIDVSLSESNNGLAEVIVTGYKNIDRKKSTSAISSITA